MVKPWSCCRSAASLSCSLGMVAAGLAGSNLPLLSSLILPLSDRITLGGNILHLQGTLHPKVILKINYEWELKAPPHTVSCGHWTFFGGGVSDVKSRRYPKLLALGVFLVLELKEQRAERQAWGWGKIQVGMCLPVEALLGKESKWKTMEK